MKRLILLVSALSLGSCSFPKEEWEKPDAITLGCENFQSIPLENAILYNNVWNKDAANGFAWKQCIEEKPETVPSVYGWSWHWPNTGHQIFAYPQIKVGTSPWEPLPKIDDRFPVKIDELDDLFVSHTLDISSNGQFNVATSMWLTTTADIGEVQNQSAIAAEVMVWTYATSKHMNPAGQQIGLIEQDGKRWSVWLDKDWSDVSGQNENRWLYITFKAEKFQLSNRFDIIGLLRDDLLSDLQLERYYIADIELGTEIMRGKGLVWINNFEIEMTSK